MKFALIPLTLLAAGISLSVQAATLVPEQGISLLFVNGQETESKIEPIELKEGETQLVLRMDKTVGKGNSKEVFTSKPYVLTFNASGDTIKLKHPKARSIQEVTRNFKNSQPEWKLIQDGKEISYQQEYIKGGNGLFPYMNMDELLKEHNQQRGIFFKGDELQKVEVVAPVVASTSAVTQVSSQQVKAQPVIASDNLEQLKAWYMKASKEERKAFRRWMIDAE
ncbi:YccT family protein [Vibrio sonorensis]|uniref:YccT family protein n=1 Tax=Vibrio sonorensis TaxID=1004316 RepID=UPI0008DAAD46|nr:DUF2057 domain-containing protein [Vibrio sonorensis]